MRDDPNMGTAGISRIINAERAQLSSRFCCYEEPESDTGRELLAIN